jgi:hypothetical protein
MRAVKVNFLGDLHDGLEATSPCRSVSDSHTRRGALWPIWTSSVQYSAPDDLESAICSRHELQVQFSIVAGDPEAEGLQPLARPRRASAASLGPSAPLPSRAHESLPVSDRAGNMRNNNTWLLAIF